MYEWSIWENSSLEIDMISNTGDKNNEWNRFGFDPLLDQNE